MSHSRPPPLFAFTHSPTLSRDAAGKKYALTQLPQPALVCDGASLSYWLHGQRCWPRRLPKSSSSGLLTDHLGGEYTDTARKARRFARGLAAAGVKLTVVFEPGRLTAPDSVRKLDAWTARSGRGTDAVGALYTYLTSDGDMSGGLPSGLSNLPAPEHDVEEVIRTLRSEGVDITVSLAAEADDDLAAFVRDGRAFAVLSDDSDFAVITGCRMLPLSFLDAEALLDGEDVVSVDPTAGSTAASSSDRAWRSASAWVFEPASVMKALGLATPRQLFATICLLGHDTTTTLLDTCEVPSKLGITASSGVKDFAQWVQAAVPATAADGLDTRLDSLLRHVPLLVGMDARDAGAWQEALAASEGIYMAAGDACAWVNHLPPAVQQVAAHTANNSLPSWALAAVAHRRVWLQRSTYERPWGSHPGGGLSAAHLVARRRMYSTLIGQSATVIEYGWDGSFWGSSVCQTPVECDAPQDLPPWDDALPWLRLRSLLHVCPTSALLPPAQDPAFRLPSDAAWAATLLRYLLTLRRVTDALIVHRLSGWQAEACIACVASCLSGEAGAVVGPRPAGPWSKPPWRFLEVSSLLQSSIGVAYACSDVAWPGTRQRAPPPSALFSGRELLRLYAAAEAHVKGAEPDGTTGVAYSTASWEDADGPSWWAGALSPGALALARQLLGAACGGIEAVQDLFLNVEPDSEALSPAEELLTLWSSRTDHSISSTHSEDVDLSTVGEITIGNSAKSTLPVEAHLGALRHLAGEHRVLCISGETGCGKSTMVPLELLKTCQAAGLTDSLVIVTQPRRIAAVALAQRVAHLLGEEVGRTVGYAIGNQRVVSDSTRLLFVTTGWLLRLASAGVGRRQSQFGRASHIVLDEAHVRSLDADFLTLLLRRRIVQAASVADVPRIVIMSATLQGDLFGPYFSSALRQAALLQPGRDKFLGDTTSLPALHVGARRFPVTEIFLDELSDKLKLTREDVIFNARAECAELANGKRRVGLTQRLTKVMARIVLHVARLGATVLVFLPGAAEIESLQLMLSVSTGGTNLPVDVYPLHSQVPPELQAAALSRASPARARVLLATDIAESSITLPDVLIVVDACLQRSQRYDAVRDMTLMTTRFVSRASAAQRAGRSGRVRPGTVVRMLPRSVFESLDAHDDPEMLVTALDNVILRGMQLVDDANPNDNVQALLASALSPPPASNVDLALHRLLERGAIEQGGGGRHTMNSLGRFAASLARLPVLVARMLMVGVAMGAGRDAVILAAAVTMSSPSPFKQVLFMFAASPVEYATDMDANTKARLAVDDGRMSDPMAWLRAFELYTSNGAGMPLRKWAQLRRQLSVRAMRNFVGDVRSLARDVPAAAKAANLTLSLSQLAELQSMAGIAADADEEGADGDLDRLVASYSTDEEAVAPQGSKVVATGKAGKRDFGVDASEREATQRWLLLLACGQNVLQGQVAKHSGYGTIVADHKMSAGQTALMGAPDAVLDAGPEVMRGMLAAAVGEAAVKKVVRNGNLAVVEFADDRVHSHLVHGTATVAMRSLICMKGSTCKLSLPLPPPTSTDVVGLLDVNKTTNVALPLTFKLPNRLDWAWICGTKENARRHPRVQVTYTSTLHGVCEDAAVNLVEQRDSGRRYACAGELMAFGENGGTIGGRILTLLPTRGIDAELWLLAAWQVGMPEIRAAVAEDGTVVGIVYGKESRTAPTWLLPWAICLSDLEAVNALRSSLNALLLDSRGVGVDTGMAVHVASFLAHCTAASRRPPRLSTGTTWGFVSLAAQDGAPGPWPPYDLSVLDPQSLAAVVEKRENYTYAP